MPSYSIVTNVNNTTTEGHAITPAVPDFSQFRILSDDNTETTYTSLTSPLGLNNKYKFGYRSLENVYKGTGIDPGLYPPVKSGCSVVCQAHETWTLEDPTDDSLPKFALPIEGHLVLRIPNNDNITAEKICEFVARMLGGLLDKDLENLSGLVRGSTRIA